MNNRKLLILVVIFTLQSCSTSSKFLESIKNHDDHTAFELLNEDSSLISARDKNGNSALHYAVASPDTVSNQ